MTDYEPTGFYKEIAARIRGHLARFEINQADLAVLCDVSQSQFSKIIRGVRPMTIDQLVVICEAIGMNMNTLMEDVYKFVSERSLQSSPIHYVIEEEREPNPTLVDEKWLDPWGVQARRRMLLGDDNVIQGSFGVGGKADTEEDGLRAVAKKKSEDRGTTPEET